MKLNQHFFAGLLAFCLLVNIHSNAQTIHTITLNVDTGMITKQTVNKYANFGQNNGVSNEEYTTTVKLGDVVKWVGVSSSSGNDLVKITSINHEGGARFFNKNVLRGSGGIVSATVSTGKAGEYEKYKVKFKVYVNGVKKRGTFMIDPKIVIKA